MKCLPVLFWLIVCSPLLGQPHRELTPDEVLKLVPDKIKGFRNDTDFKSKRMTVGNITYSLCEKRFQAAGQKEIKILLFDFKNAPMMYAQAMRKWNHDDLVDSDSVVLRTVQLDNCTGWESYHRESDTSRIFLGICDRFFLTMTGEKVGLDKLKEIVMTLPFEQFPR